MARTRGLILAVGLWLASPLSHAVVAPPPPLPQPSWAQLNTEQQRALAPLAGEWDTMDGFRRKKWLGIAQRYSSLSPDEQTRMQRRMTDWAKLTPEERKRAREKYRSLQKAPPEKKEAVKRKWEEYKGLPESERNRIKAEAVRKPSPRSAPLKQAVTPSPAVSSASPPPAAPVDQPTGR